MILHFYGIPGAGKTSFVNKIIKSNKESLKIYNITDLTRNNFFYKLIYKFLFFSFSIFYKKHRKYIGIKKILSDYQVCKPKYSDADIDYYIKTIIFQLYLSNFFSKFKNIFVFDEGIPQQIANLGVNFSLTDDDTINILNYIDSQYRLLTIYYFCEIDVSVSSIKNRNRHVTKIDYLEGEDLISFLNKYKHYTDLLYKTMESQFCSRKSSIGENLQSITSYLEKRGIKC